MAKHRSTALARPVIVQVPRAPGRARRAARRVGAGVRHVARRSYHGGKKALPTMGIALGGLVAGYASGKGYLDKLPKIGGSSVVTLGIAGYAATRFLKNKFAREAGLACLAAAAFDFGKVQAGGTSGFDDMGDAGGGPNAGQGY